MIRKNCTWSIFFVLVAVLVMVACGDSSVSPTGGLDLPLPSSNLSLPPTTTSNEGSTTEGSDGETTTSSGEFSCSILDRYKFTVHTDYLNVTLNYEIEGLPPNIVDGHEEGYILQVWWAGHTGGNADPGTYDPTNAEMNANHRVYNIGAGPDISGSEDYLYPASLAGKKLKVVIYLQPKRAVLSDDPNGQCDQGRYARPELPPPPPPPPECEGEECDPQQCDLENLRETAAQECGENGFELDEEKCSFECLPPPPLCETNPSDPQCAPECEGEECDPQETCPFNPNLPADDPACVPPPPPCPFDPTIPINHPECVPPPCPFNPQIPANDPACHPPEPVCNLPAEGPYTLNLDNANPETECGYFNSDPGDPGFWLYKAANNCYLVSHEDLGVGVGGTIAGFCLNNNGQPREISHVRECECPSTPND